MSAGKVSDLKIFEQAQHPHTVSLCLDVLGAAEV